MGCADDVRGAARVAPVTRFGALGVRVRVGWGKLAAGGSGCADYGWDSGRRWSVRQKLTAKCGGSMVQGVES